MASNHYALNHSGGGTTIFNPSPLPGPAEIDNFPWQKVDWLIVNEGEALDLYNALTHTNTTASSTSESQPIRELINGLSKQPSLCKTNIICTLGKDGVLAFIPAFHKSKSSQDTSTFLYLPAAKLQGTIRDTTGAGDCFTGYFVEGLMEFGAHAKIGSEIQEEDIAQILKVCVQVNKHCFLTSFQG
jgi:ribokinase